MAESNIANTTTIYGRTNYLNVTDFNQILVSNAPESGVVYKINSLFIANKDENYAVDVDIRIVRIVGAGAYAEVKSFYIARAITVPRDATLIAVCRDNPIYLEPGDMVQVRAGINSRADATVSYEFITDTVVVPPTLTVPSAPLNLTAEPGNATISLYWSEPAANGGTPVFDYVIQVSSRPDSSTAWPVFTTLTKPESAARSFSLAATNGHEYRFRVGALNGLGVGAWSDVTDIVTPTSFAAPSNLTATAYNASALINWSTPGSTGGQVITQYAVRWSIDDGQTWLPSRTGILTGSVTTAKTILNLQNNIPYVFSVRGVSLSAAGVWSVPSTQVIPLSSSPPPPINSANYSRAANWNATTNGNLLSVGTSGSTSAYGLYDMNGNVNEWLETRSIEASSSTDAYTPGGAFTDALTNKLASTGFISAGAGLDTQQYLSVGAKTPTCGFRLVSFETSPVILHSNIFMAVGDIGNSNSAVNGFLFRSFGAVPYAYKIQKYEVSNAEYVDFLNDVDPTGTNTLGLYDANMTSNVHGGITYNAAGPSGARYEIKQNMAAKPVNFVSWYSSIRYANWLHNGQTGPGTTEDGAYECSSAFPTGGDDPITDFTNYAVTPAGGSDGSDSDLSLVRKTGAKYVLPTTHEWFKAAFYKGGGTQAGYWEYATRSNTPPSAVTATATGNGVL